MNKEKIKNFIKSKTVVGIICFMIGATLVSNGTTETERQLKESKGQISTIQDRLNESENKLGDAQAKLKTLEDKLSEAKPFFDMKDEEQKQLQAKADKDKADREAQDKAKADADAKAKIEAKSKTLSNGNFVSGTDFDAGVYTITVVSGNGNVWSNNQSSGGINAIMGTINEEIYQKEYKNIKLPSGTTLTIRDVTIKLTPVE